MITITAYPLYQHAVPLRAADESPIDSTGYAASPMVEAADIRQQGWTLLCPHGFEATWNGGPNPEDIEIRPDPETASDTGTEEGIDFVQSQMGNGLLTFYSGYQCKTEDGYLLWVRGPINGPKDGLSPLESLVDASLLPSTITIHWQFTRPQQTVRFAVGEPFATLLPHAKTDLHDAQLEIAQFDAAQLDAEDELDAYETAFQQMVDSPSMQDVFQRMGAITPGSASAEEVPPKEARDENASEAASRWAAELVDPPPVSCICPTYGRVDLLEEAIESFLRQDYPGQKELIVLNDYAGQALRFDHPEVHVINVSQRLHSIGEKYKMAVSLASHDLLFVWHDDDIYLPHRLSYSVHHLGAHKEYYRAEKAWFWDQGQVSGPDENLFHGGSCWRRKLFDRVQGYPHINNGYDREFEQQCRSVAPSTLYVHSIRAADIYYIYRWGGTGSYHTSTMGSEPGGYEQVAAYVAQQAQSGAIPQGEVQLHPQWRSDYGALVEQHLATLSAEEVAEEEEIPFPPPYFVIPPPPAMPEAHTAQLFRGDYPLAISVILPASNESVLLQRTVEQFAATLPENSEIIVVDNGSTDGSSDFLLDEPCPNIHLIRTPEALGVAGARNRGLAQAQGEVVVFADAHIDLPERWWQPMVCTVNQPHVGVVGPGIGVMGRPDNVVAYGQRIAEPNLRVEWLQKEGEEPYPVPTLGGGFMVMRHDTLKAAGAFDAGMPQWGSEDLEICVRYWLLGYEVWVVPSVTILHYFRKANPYKVEWGAITHNLLRVGLLHLSGERLTRVVAALKGDAKFENALTHAVDSDVWQQRADFAARRVHDDDWLFEKFAESCNV